MHEREAEAGVHAPAVDVDGARAALAVIAAFLRAGEGDGLAHAVEQRGARVDAESMRGAIDAQGHRNRASISGRSDASCFAGSRSPSPPRFAPVEHPAMAAAAAAELAT